MTRFRLLAALWAIFFFAAPASAATSMERFWVGFRHFWGGIFSSLGGVVGMVLLAGAVGVFIITRGKWLK